MLLLADDLLLMLLLTLLGRATGTETSATGTVAWLLESFGRMEEVEQEDTWTGVLEVGVETGQGGG